ncbi:MAG: SRPBCC family protein [Alphaproteobacteria bacterium]
MAHDQLVATISVDLEPQQAFERFLALESWWPRAYSWSGEALVDLSIDPRAGGLLTETGPHGFRCDFGRVLAIEPPRHLLLSWQISPRREPQPDPAQASEVELSFAAAAAGTSVTLAHRHFRRHGPGHEQYREAMAAEQGWPYLLRCFAGRI